MPTSPPAFPVTKRAFLAMAAGTVGLMAPPSVFAQNELHGTVDQGNIQPLPIAIDVASATDAQGNSLGAQIAKIIRDDLERSGYFKPIDPNAFIDRDIGVAVMPTFDHWRTINAQYLANGAARTDADGRLAVDIQLWDVFNTKDPKDVLISTTLAGSPANPRKIAHKIADLIYEKLTGQEGYFDTSIAFVAESGKRGARVKRLAIMDQDGFGASYLTNGSLKVMTPRFSADGQLVAYMALSADSARIYIFNLETGRQESVGEVKGMAFAPRFSPDGSKLAFSVSQAGATNIYVMDLSSRRVVRLTSGTAINTSPSFSPDGSQIAFTSDRGGSPQIYLMNGDGGNVRRITFGGGMYSTPVFSPKGDMIAFTKQSGGRFSIGVMKPDGSGEKLLTSSYLEEGPTWAPNGRYIMFFREPPGGSPSLWMVEAAGRVERPVPYAGGASDPAWSPRLK